MSLQTAYEFIAKQFPHAMLESFEVVRQVEEYRQFWKPKEVKVVLLGESHVYTESRDYQTKLKRSIIDNLIRDYPTNFVRFVYCLGYGENEILERALEDNSGTPQYWKIFSSCIALSAENKRALGFERILKTQTPNLTRRLRNKINVLRQMQEKGVWLLDASIVGLYRSTLENNETKKRIIEICWDNHIAKIIEESNPKHMIIIGKGVKDALRFKLWNLNLPHDQISTIPSPQERTSSETQLENYKKYQRICSKA
jgi:hypothetical protein